MIFPLTNRSTPAAPCRSTTTTVTSHGGTRQRRLPARRRTAREQDVLLRAPARLVDHLRRSRRLELPTNTELKLFARPGEAPDAFAARCAQTADERADAEIAKLRDKYESKVTTLRRRSTAPRTAPTSLPRRQGQAQLGDAVDRRVDPRWPARRAKVARRAARLGPGHGRHRRRSARSHGDRRAGDAAENKVDRLQDQLEELEAELAAEVTEIDARWMALAKEITNTSIALERTDVKVTTLVVAWIPVS